MYRPGRHQARERRQHTIVELMQSRARSLRRTRIVGEAEENRVCRRSSLLARLGGRSGRDRMGGDQLMGTHHRTFLPFALLPAE